MPTPIVLIVTATPTNIPTPLPWTQLNDPDGGPIYWEQVKTGTINTISDTDTWIFYGVSGQLIMITMTGRGSLPRDLKPLLELYDPTGVLVEVNSTGDGSGANARIQNITLQSSGTYTIVAKGQGATKGSYSLALSVGGS